jgi:membrane-bound serine protease (ClpP class)
MSEPIVIVASLIIAGYLLLAMEVLVVPGFGVPGVAGLGCLIGGCALAYLWFEPLPATLAIVGVVGATTGLLIWLPRTRMGAQMVHRGSLGDAHAAGVPLYEGDRGVAESDLRPSGIARFGEVRESVVTDGEFLTAGTAVSIVQIHGSRVVVEAASAADAPETDVDTDQEGED